MGQSLVQNYIHIVFSTKNREKLILPEYEEQLFKYLGGICKNNECNPVQVGGYLDHIHILCILSKKITVSQLLEDLKSNSSKWIKTLDIKMNGFYWQRGYGVFSVSKDRVDTVKRYIKNQKNHHTNITFQDEYKKILEELSIEYNELYLWD
ncbi:MAG: IS200/IS605 family transposase [Saprospiraceae bacterium]